MGGKPEFLAADGLGKAYINLVDKDQVAVVDSKTMKVLNKWPTSPGGSPVGMAMDTARRRLFIGCRKPQKLVIMSMENGKVLADLPIGAGVSTRWRSSMATPLPGASRRHFGRSPRTPPGKFATCKP